MKPKEFLIEVDKLLSKKEKWTKGAFARNKEGGLFDELDYSKAYCFCLYGAMDHLRNKLKISNSDYYDADILLDRLVDEKGFCGYIEFNDAESTTFRKVKNLLRKAINSL